VNQGRKPEQEGGSLFRLKLEACSDPAWGGAPANDVVLFGEVYGSGIQDLWYGLENGRFALRAFDLAVNGRYLDVDVKTALFAGLGVEEVPILYRGPFSRAGVEAYVSGLLPGPPSLPALRCSRW
jgi:hypothetical protein